jgi:glycosyltransferase involved in cell wall biosynthesis
MRSSYKIVHLTDSHLAIDERIFHKAGKLTRAAGYKVAIIGLHSQAENLDGIDIFPIKKNTSKIRKLFCSLTSFLLLANKSNADIYQFHDPGLIPLGLVLRLIGKKVIYDVHEDYQQKLLTRLKLPMFLRKLISEIWWVFEYVLSMAFNHLVVADSHIQTKFKNEKTTVIPNVPGKEFWENRIRTRADTDEIRIVYVGTITRDRGIIETIQAMQFIKHDHVTFHIFGPTQDRSLIDLFNSAPNVFYHGFVKWTELGDELVNADIATVLLQPVSAYSACTGTGIVKLWEYMSLGLPILISNFPALEKLCTEIGFGLPVDPTDPRKIAGAIDYLIDHPQERRRFSENGKKVVFSEYNAEKKLKALIDVYDNLVGVGA